MTGRPCGLCGGATTDGARFCARCGAPLDATVIALDRDDHANAHDHAGGSRAEDRRRPRRTAGLAVAAAIALVTSIAVLGDGAADLADVPATTPTPVDRNEAPRPIPSATPTAGPTGTPRATATPAVAAARVDPAALPPMAATHLAVLGDGTLQFLDLTTGVWTRSPAEETPSLAMEPAGMHAVSGAVLVTAGNGTPTLAPVEGSVPVELIDDPTEWLVGISDTTIVVSSTGPVANSSVIESREFDGALLWSFELPRDWWPAGVTPDGGVVVQAAERVVLLDGASGRRRVLGTGNTLTVIRGSAVVWSCDADLRCATVQIDASSGARTALADTPLYFEQVGADRWIGHRDGTDTPQPYRLVDGVLTPVAELIPTNVGARAVDPTGTLVAARGGRLVFSGPDGDVLARIPSPVAPGRTVVLALVTATG